MYSRLLIVLVLLLLPLPSFADETARVFGLDKVWSLHLKIQPKDWEKMKPTNRPGPFGGGFGPMGGKAKEKPADPDADRRPHGLFGLDFEYVKALLEIDGKTYKEVGVRFKGSGTYIAAQGRLKVPFKIDLDRYVEGQEWRGVRKLRLNNNAMEATGTREVLAYGVFRDLGVPTPRTAFATLTLTIPGKYDKEFVGLYVLAESVDKAFLKDRFGSSKGMLLKPERVGAMEYLGEEWGPYEKSYQPKTDASKKQQKRLIDFTRLVQKADDKTFAKEIESYLDVDRFLRFLAAHVALSSMDSFVGMARNYYLYLDPKTNKFVFLPWDVDLAFGSFVVVGPINSLIDLSIKQPTATPNRLIDRILANKTYFETYKKHLDTAVTKVMTVENIKRDLKTVHATIDPLMEKEKKAVVARKEPRNSVFGGLFASVPTVDGFVEKRIVSVKEQLAEERKGTVLARFGFGGPMMGGKGPAMGGPPPGGFGFGQMLTRPILDAADKDKDSKLSKDELTTGVKALFKNIDADNKGEVDQKTIAAGLDKLLPRPAGMGRPPAGFPTLGEILARGIVEKERAGKDGKVNEARLLEYATKVFTECDRNKDGMLEQKELAEAVNKLMLAPQFPKKP